MEPRRQVGYGESCGKPLARVVEPEPEHFRPPARSRAAPVHDRLFEDAEILAERQREAQAKHALEQRHQERLAVERLDLMLAKERRAAAAQRGKHSVHDRLFGHAAVLAARQRSRAEAAAAERAQAEEEAIQPAFKGTLPEREAGKFYDRLYNEKAELDERRAARRRAFEREELMQLAAAAEEKRAKPPPAQVVPLRKPDKRPTVSIHDRLYAKTTVAIQDKRKGPKSEPAEKRAPRLQHSKSDIFDRLYKEKDARDQRRASIHVPSTKAPGEKPEPSPAPARSPGQLPIHERLYREQEEIMERRRILTDGGKRVPMHVPGHPEKDSRRSSFLPWHAEEARSDRRVPALPLDSEASTPQSEARGGELGADLAALGAELGGAAEFQIWTPRPEAEPGALAAPELSPPAKPSSRWQLLMDNAI